MPSLTHMSVYRLSQFHPEPGQVHKCDFVGYHYGLRGGGSVKPRVMTPQSSVNFPKTHLKTAQNSGKQYKKRVLRAVFALLVSLTYGVS